MNGGYTDDEYAGSVSIPISSNKWFTYFYSMLISSIILKG